MRSSLLGCVNPALSLQGPVCWVLHPVGLSLCGHILVMTLAVLVALSCTRGGFSCSRVVQHPVGTRGMGLARTDVVCVRAGKGSRSAVFIPRDVQVIHSQELHARNESSFSAAMYGDSTNRSSAGQCLFPRLFPWFRMGFELTVMQWEARWGFGCRLHTGTCPCTVLLWKCEAVVFYPSWITRMFSIWDPPGFAEGFKASMCCAQVCKMLCKNPFQSMPETEPVQRQSGGDGGLKEERAHLVPVGTNQGGGMAAGVAIG